ncbi:MAG: HAD-IC family P-type ATPase [Syntrophales bacterium]|nr:HAD-IC family P-type ATPase [Syntrophales bacterium]
MPVLQETQTEAAERPYYTLPSAQVLETFGAGPAGLSASQARERLEQYGPNELTPPQKISPWIIFLRQFQNLLIIILIAATGISFFLGEHLDAYIILVIILACTILGFVQEYRAEQAAAALQKLAAPEATVLREGKERVIPAREVIPGDVLVLHTGDKVAADGRLLEAVNLKNDESLLTGESTSVSKAADPLPQSSVPVADQKNMVFGGTVVTYGRGKAVVTATGMKTEFGSIARMLGEVAQEKTPLEERMASIGLVLSILCLAVSAGAVVFGVIQGQNWLQMLIWGISLAVAAVFARVAPEHKLRLVDLLKAQGQIVAMTGDGVNDAPALKRADIGVAMGITGTEVTKETADMILADDNFATLVAAVEEGRAIFDNIKKYLMYLLSANLGEIMVLTGTFFLGMPLPLVALQILWVNLTTDGLPALALGVDPKAPDIMARPPRPPQEGVFTRPVIALMVVTPAYLTVALIPLFHHYYHGYLQVMGDPELSLTRAQTMVFVTLVLAELVRAYNCRSDYYSVFSVGLFSNRLLIGATILSLLMMVAVVQAPPLAGLFHAVPLSWKEWLFAAFLAGLLFPVLEITKWVMRQIGGPATGLPA